jgi:hypothetical protein
MKPLSKKKRFENSIRINIEVPSEMNEERKKLQATWRDVLKTGLAFLPGKESEIKKPLYDPAIEENLKLSVKHLSDAWNIIKKTK